MYRSGRFFQSLSLDSTEVCFQNSLDYSRKRKNTKQRKIEGNNGVLFFGTSLFKLFEILFFFIHPTTHLFLRSFIPLPSSLVAISLLKFKTTMYISKRPIIECQSARNPEPACHHRALNCAFVADLPDCFLSIHGVQ